MMPKSDASYLTINYQHPGKEAEILSIALLVPTLNSIELYIREDLEFAAEDDIEYFEALADSFESLAAEKRRAQYIFEWMESNLSNVVFVEGPNRIEVSYPGQAIRLVYEQERAKR